MEAERNSLNGSVLDRLLDNEPRNSRESVRDRLFSIGQVKAAVIRDLENLLNTKGQHISPPATYKEVNNSLYVYGLRDYTAHNPRSRMVKHHLRQNIEKTIKQFEPRLKNVMVQFETLNKKEQNLRFRITAMLVIEPVTEPVTFDTYFDVSRGQYHISQ